ncbi:hypothetical protein GCM10023210_12660 [Chryseobacterium ginsengisoli]|uniref:DUF5063 domain-containing protein n=1 Tax=Chryseobacterium ginsengisoli TaxID=363853 RepID=A0ABP9M3Q2_9FLAO
MHLEINELISTINNITKYGLKSNLVTSGQEKELKKNLVKIYYLYFLIEYKFDKNNFVAFDKAKYFDIRKNVTSNFKDLGYYKIVLDIHDIDNKNDYAIGDAVDDLTHIILDLLEIKWRIENNSPADGLWFFDFIFKNHTQQHIIDLLNYMEK